MASLGSGAILRVNSFSTSAYLLFDLCFSVSAFTPLFFYINSSFFNICSAFFLYLFYFFYILPLFQHLFLGYRLSLFSCLGLAVWSYLFLVTRLSDFLCLPWQLTAAKSAFLSLNLECKGDFCLSGSAKKTFRKHRKTFRKCKKCGKEWPEYPEKGGKCVKIGGKCVNWCIFNLKSLLFDLYFVRLHYLCIRKRFLMVKVYG